MTSTIERLWSGRFLLAMSINFFSMMTFYMLLTTMALYAVDRFEATEALAGFASSAFVVGALLARLFTGKFLDFIGRRRLLISVLLALTLIGLLYLPANNIVLLIIVRFLHGMAFGATSTTLSASMLSLIPRHRRGEGIGYYGTAMTLASAVGPFVALQLIARVGFEALLIGAIITAAIGLLLSLGLRLPERTPSPDERARLKRMHPTEFLAVEALPIAAVMALIAVAYSTVITFLNSYGRADGMTDAASWFFVVYAGALLVTRLTVGKRQDRRGDNAVFYPVLVIFALGMVVLATASNGITLWIAAALIGLGYGSTLTGGQTVAVTMSPDHRVGVAVSTYLVSMDVGIGLGPVLFGLLIPHVGYRGMYLAVAGLVLVTVLVYHLLHGRKRHGGLRH